MPGNTKRKHALSDGTQKPLSRKEMTQCFQWPRVLCSKDNFLVLVDECHISLGQKGGTKLDLGPGPNTAFLPNALYNFSA